MSTLWTDRGDPLTPLVEWSENDDVRDGQFLKMLRAFRRSGGLARDAEILASIEGRRPAWRRHASSGQVICFEWGQKLWLPWFQFERADMSLRRGPAEVIAELASVFDSWELAAWFAEPNIWIGDATPVDLIDDCLEDVLGAARADRFIAAG